MVFKYTLLNIIFNNDEPTPRQKNDTKEAQPPPMPTMAPPPPPPAAAQQQTLIQDSLSRERITNARTAAFTEKFDHSIPIPPPQQEHPALRSPPPPQEPTAFKSQVRFA